MLTQIITKIDEVTVFDGFVLVNRTGAFSLRGDSETTSTNGEWTFTISDLPLLLEDATLRIRLEEDQHCILRDVRVNIIETVEKEQDSDKLRSELEMAERKLEEMQRLRYNQLKVIEEVERWIDEPLPEPPIKDGRQQEKPAFPVENYNRYIDDLTDVLKKELQKLRELEQEIVRYEREYKAKAAMAEYREPRLLYDPVKRWKKKAVIKVGRLSAESATKDVPFTLSYCIRKARWAPVYSIDVRENNAQLAMSVNVSQRTGEDWQGIRMKFSAASIHRISQLPELPSLRIGRAQPSKPKKVRPAPKPVTGLLASYADWFKKADAPKVLSANEKYPVFFEKAEGLTSKGFDLLQTNLQDQKEDLKKVVAAKPGKFDFFIEKNILSREECKKAITIARNRKAPVETILMSELRVSKQDIGKALSRFYKVPFVEYNQNAPVPIELIANFKIPYLRQNLWVPLREEDGKVVIAIDNPNDIQKTEDIKKLFRGKPIALSVALKQDILDYIKLFTPKEKDRTPLDEILLQLEEDDFEEYENEEMSESIEDLDLDVEPASVMISQKAAPPSKADEDNGLLVETIEIGSRVLPEIGRTVDYREFELNGPEDGRFGTLRQKIFEIRSNQNALKGYKRYLADFQDPGPKIGSHFFQIYDSQGLADIPSDGKLHTVRIGTRQCDVRKEYRSAPVMEPKVYGRLSVQNPFKFPLPKGPAAVYHDGAFAFSTRTEAASIGGRILFPAGVEERIKIARNVSYQESPAGLIATETVATHQIEIEVKSNMPRPVTLEILDRIPFTDEKNKDIEITALKSEPPADELTTYEDHVIRGGRRFNLELEPGKKHYCRFGYKVTIPAKKELVGGNRRE